MKKTLLPLVLALALTGCAVPPNSPLMGLAMPEMRQAVAALAQRTPADMAITDKLIAHVEPGKAGYCRLSSGKPFVVIRDHRDHGNLVHIWITDTADRLVNIETHTDYQGGHVYLRNPTLTPWRSWEEPKARKLYDQVAAKMAADPNTAPAFGPWPPATTPNPAQAAGI
jgi:hypothetical protein